MKCKRKKKPEPVASFKVRPEGRSLFAQVYVWKNKTAMYRHKPISRSHVASCTGVEVYDCKKNRVRKTGQFAEIHFNLNNIGIEVVTHEMTHAAFCWAERVRLPLEKVISEQNWEENRTHSQTLPEDGPEERFCYALGVMAREFTQKCYDLGLYEEVVQAKT